MLSNKSVVPHQSQTSIGAVKTILIALDLKSSLTLLIGGSVPPPSHTVPSSSSSHGIESIHPLSTIVLSRGATKLNKGTISI